MKRLRANMTPFLKAISKALSAELELGIIDGEMEKSIIDKIIQKIPAENSTSTTRFFSGQTYDTLHAEFNGLMNLR